MRRYYLPGDVALSLEAQDLLARIFTPDPARRIPLAKARRHPWLRESPSVLAAAHGSAADAAASSGTQECALDAQSEEGIQQAHPIFALLM